MQVNTSKGPTRFSRPHVARTVRTAFGGHAMSPGLELAVAAVGRELPTMGTIIAHSPATQARGLSGETQGRVAIGLAWGRAWGRRADGSASQQRTAGVGSGDAQRRRRVVPLLSY